MQSVMRRSGAWAALVLFVAGAAFAAPKGGRDPDDDSDEPRMEAPFKRLKKGLNLTPEQEKKLEAHQKSQREQVEGLMDDLEDKRHALRDELEKPEFSADRAKALQAQLKEAQGKIADHRLNGILEVRQILTPAQYKKFQKMMKRGGRRGGMSGRGGGRGGPHGKGMGRGKKGGKPY